MASTSLDREALDQAVARGSDLLKQGKLDDAQKAFRAALLIDGENPRVLALLGLTHFRAGQFTQARPIYEELVERLPTDPSHRLNLGLVYLKLGESDKAIGSLEASRALDPSQGRAVSYLGLAYARAGRYAEAYRSFLMAGQNDLATEIEVNLTAAERDGIQAQLRGSPERKQPPPPPPRSEHSRIDIPLSMPAIVIDRFGGAESRSGAEGHRGESIDRFGGTRPVDDDQQGAPITSRTMTPASEPEIIIDVASRVEIRPPKDDEADRAFSELQAVPGSPAATPSSEIQAPSVSDSVRFVLPERDAVPEPAPGQSMVSRAVEVASPASAAAAPVRIASGSTAPIPLSQLATDQLVRPEEGGEMFEVTASGALVIRVSDRVLTRLEGVHVTGGELEYEPATRRSRGSQTDERFDYGGPRLHSVEGTGYLIAVPGDQQFTAVTLDDDIFYLREDLVFAFDASLRWENGNVPGLRGKLPVVQFRGDGAVALRTSKQLVRVKLPAQGVLYIDAMRLAGWIGRVIPRAVVPPSHGPMGDLCVECTGEGVVLIDPTGTPPAVTVRDERPTTRPPEIHKSTPPPPPQPSAAPDADAAGPPQGSGLIELDIVKNADWLADDETDGEKSAAKPDES